MAVRRAALSRLAVASLLLAALLAYACFGGQQLLTLQSLENGRDALLAEVRQAPVRSALLFVLGYAALAACALPVAGVMNLAAGALFGVVEGTALALVGSTAGATLSMLSARFLARDWLLAHWPRQLARINRGIERDGAAYLVSLRIAPGTPFPLINLAIGLTNMRPLHFAFWSAVGSVPGVLVFTYSGQALSRIRSIGDIVSPGLAGALLALALVPLAGKALARWLSDGRGPAD